MEDLQTMLHACGGAAPPENEGKSSGLPKFDPCWLYITRGVVSKDSKFAVQCKNQVKRAKSMNYESVEHRYCNDAWFRQDMNRLERSVTWAKLVDHVAATHVKQKKPLSRAERYE